MMKFVIAFVIVIVAFVAFAVMNDEGPLNRQLPQTSREHQLSDAAISDITGSLNDADRVTFAHWAARQTFVDIGMVGDPTPGYDPVTVGDALAEQRRLEAPNPMATEQARRDCAAYTDSGRGYIFRGQVFASPCRALAGQ
jgi:hypothetical protein